MLRVLILDDDPHFGRTLERSLSRNDELPCAVTAVTTDEDAYRLVAHAQTPFDVFLIDQRLGPGPDGINVLGELLRLSPNSSAIVFASFDLDSGMQAYRAGAYRYLHKPFQTQELILILRSLCEWRNTRTERDGLRILAEIAEEAQRTHDLQSLGEVIVRGACRFGFGRARLWLLNQTGELLNGLSRVGDTDSPPINEMSIPVSESIYMRRVFERQQPMIFRGEELGPSYLARHFATMQRPKGEWVSLPLCLGDRCLGALSLDHSQHLVIRPDQLIELKLLAQQAAAALERVQLAEQERRRSRELEVLADIGRRTAKRAAHGDLDALLGDIHKLVSQLLDACNFFVVLRDDAGGPDEYRLVVVDGERHKAVRRPRHSGLIGAVISDNAPLLLQGEETITSYRRQRRARAHRLFVAAHCFLGVPLQVNGQAIGALAAFSIDNPHAYTAESMRVLTAVAGQVAGAIQVTRLKKAAERHTEQLALLQRANETLLKLGEQHTDWLWHITLTLATAYYGLGFNRALLFLLDRHGRVLKGEMGIGQLNSRTAKLHWRSDFQRKTTFDDYLDQLQQGELRPTEADGVVRDMVLPIAEAGVFAEVLHSRVTEVIAAQSPALPAHFRASFGDTSYAVLPLLVGEKPLGVVVVDNIHNHEPLEAMPLRELETLLAQVALVHDNVRQRRANDRLIEVSTMVLAQVATLTLSETLNRISEAAKEIAGAESVSIHPLLPDMPADAPVYDHKHIGHSGLSGAIHFRAKPSPSGVTIHVLRTGQPLPINDVRTFIWNQRPLLAKGTFLERHGVRAFIAVPIRDALIGERTGVLFLNYSTPQIFSDHDIRRAKGLAELAGSAIRTCRAEQEVIDSRNAAVHLSQARGRELKILQDVLETALKPTVDPAEHQDIVAQKLLIAACDLLHIEETQVALVLRDWEANGNAPPSEVRRQYFLNIDQQLVIERRESVYTGITGAALRNGEDILIEDVTEERWSHLFRPRHEGDIDPIVPPTMSELDVLIKLEGDQILGLFNLESPLVGAFTSAHQQTLKRLAAVGALALNNVRRQYTLLNVLDVARAMIIATDVNTTLQAIVQAAGALAFGVSAVTIWYKEPVTGKLVPGPAFGLHDQALVREGYLKPTGVLTYVMQSQEPIWAETIELDSPLHSAFIPREGIVSAAAFPLQVIEPGGSAVVGALFFNYRENHSFSREERVLFPLLATIAAASVRDALRLQSIQAERKRLDAFKRITEAVGATVGLDETLRRIMRVLVELFPDASPTLLMYNSVHQSLEFHPAAMEFYTIQLPDAMRWLDINGNQSIACRVAREAIRSAAPVIENIGDVRNDQHYLRTISGTRSELCCALMGMSRGGPNNHEAQETTPPLLGVLVLESPELNAFSDDDVEIMRGIGLAVSTALDRAYSSAQLRFASSVAAATAWVHEIAHDINNEIGTIRRQAYLLGQQLIDYQLTQGFVRQIDASAERLAEFARAPRLENARPICLNAWLEHKVAEIVARSRRSSAITYHFELSPVYPGVCVPPVLLERAVRHLVRNGLEAMGKEGRLTVRTVCIGREVEVQIANTGPDIPESVRQTLFLDQVTTKHAERQSDEGGLGLLFVRWAVEAMQGKVYLLSRPCDEVTFAFRLPLADGPHTEEALP